MSAVLIKKSKATQKYPPHHNDLLLVNTLLLCLCLLPQLTLQPSVEFQILLLFWLVIASWLASENSCLRFKNSDAVRRNRTFIWMSVHFCLTFPSPENVTDRCQTCPNCMYVFCRFKVKVIQTSQDIPFHFSGWYVWIFQASHEHCTLALVIIQYSGWTESKSLSFSSRLGNLHLQNLNRWLTICTRVSMLSPSFLWSIVYAFLCGVEVSS